MKLIQLTDIHLTTPGQTIGGRDPNANFEAALTHALSQHPDTEAIVITGDLSDWGDRADYERLRARIATLPVPVHLAIGNHDDRAIFLQVFPELADADGHVQSRFPLSRGTGLVIDTWGPRSHAGFFCAKRCAWLEQALTVADAPVFLFMHHNPVPTYIAPLDHIMLRDSDTFGAVIATHRQHIAHIFFGHCHLPLSGSLYGVPVSGSRGTNHAGWADFTERHMLLGSDLPQAYAVIVANGATVTVQMVEFGYRGERRIEGSPDYDAWNRTTMVR
ncbi:3',5'-cyclic-nucleotide phosphodiesterase [Bradyrhizobium macuxiense]|uniref:3',5'-cyclic-nucleotide phosphodiesterase n=2 Tax=Bradyrhizobium macuxiense TaxID=1755647 RepID=A0A109K3I8_9BRAD|nr:3',5'-cyclic-nucleotide phosphodiesterase [Bradyrhizobium macuxiense]